MARAEPKAAVSACCASAAATAPLASELSWRGFTVYGLRVLSLSVSHSGGSLTAL